MNFCARTRWNKPNNIKTATTPGMPKFQYASPMPLAGKDSTLVTSCARPALENDCRNVRSRTAWFLSARASAAQRMLLH